MARHDIRGVKKEDGSYALTAKDIYNINDNNIQISQEVYGSSDFTKKLDKQVKKNTTDIADITTRVGDTEGSYTEVVQSVDAVTTRVTNVEGSVSTAQQTADAVTLNFNNQIIGGRNLLKNGGFEDGFEYWSKNMGTEQAVVSTYNSYEDQTLLVTGEANENSSGVYQRYLNFKVGESYTISAMVYVEKPMKFGVSNSLVSVPASVGWKRIVHTFTATAEAMSILFLLDDGIVKRAFYLDNVKVEMGNKSTAWSANQNEMRSLSHIFNASGYTIRDSSGAELMSLSKGVANEQNIGRVDNVADGYPMKLPFHIGSQVNQITQAILKWDIAPFRTYSEGAASGGGATSGDGGSWSSTVGVYDWTQGTAAGTDSRTIDTNNLGMPHSHTTATSNLAHRHSVAVPNHQHSTPAHAHSPKFGILITPVTSNWFSVYIDGTYRTAVEAVRGEIDLSAWITTNGWHTIELRVTSLKRIDANLFLKTYIRR